MNQEITVIEVFEAIGRLPEEERVCMLQFMNLPGLANVISTEKGYKELVDKLDYFVETYKVAIQAIKNIHKDIEKQKLIAKNKKSWRDSINPFKGKGSSNEQSEKQA